VEIVLWLGLVPTRLAVTTDAGCGIGGFDGTPLVACRID